MKYIIEKEKLEKIVKNSTSMSEVLRLLNVTMGGGNYKTIKNKIKLWDVDTSHFLGQSWARGNVIGRKRPIEDYLTNKIKIKSDALKHRLINEGLKEHKCEKCGNVEWMGNKIPLELHHKDGNHDNNEFKNLEILCPNCHAQTPNHAGKGIKNKKHKKCK